MLLHMLGKEIQASPPVQALTPVLSGVDGAEGY